MKLSIRNKLIFTGEPDNLKTIANETASADGTNPLSFERILPLNGQSMEQVWGIPALPEEMDSILYRNDTILEYSFITENQIPMPVYQKLAETYPFCRMRVEYAGEDYGEECGMYEAVEGSKELESRELDDPFVFACDVWEVDPEEEMQERMINEMEE